MVRSAFAKTTFILVVGAALSAEALPQTYQINHPTPLGESSLAPYPSSAVNVGFGNKCDDISGVNYARLSNQGLTCNAIPGKQEKICIKTVTNAYLLRE
ncbi:hypothetical protein BDF19DRAFT_425285 [Syncephalis fuscata]|nr:hypothetical protein BDF19DRAFT_425285 [Syncephalis fuscata]